MASLLAAESGDLGPYPSPVAGRITMITHPPLARPAAAALLGCLLLALTPGRSDAGDALALDDGQPHAAMRRAEYGTGPRSYWLFEPRQPTPETAPLVVFLHGWLAVNPGVYGAWIDHLVRSGHIVVFPRYQDDVATHPGEFLPNALEAVNDAIGVLTTSPGHVRPDLKRFALIGHSAGGNLAAQMAAVSDEADLPRPRAVVVVTPGEVRALAGPDLALIPSTTLLVVAVADQDFLVGDSRGRHIFAQASSIPASRKKFVLYRTDRHGKPWLVADHTSPTGALPSLGNGNGLFPGAQMNLAGVDPLDRAGYWRMADLTLDAGFRGKTLDEATAGGAEFRQMGFWSDGRPVLPPIVGDDLTKIPRVVLANGLRLIAMPGAVVDKITR
ncbi:alpha/beta hydrolase [Isosphaeraceae bacterium EP7]